MKLLKHTCVLIGCLIGICGSIAGRAATAGGAGPDVSLIDAKSANGGSVLRVRALDSATGGKVKAFRVISGIGVGSIEVPKEFTERHPAQDVVNWQPHTTEIGADGLWEREFERAYEPLAIRVEADGYIPQRCLWIDKKKGSQEVVFKLVKDPGVQGRVVLPDGSPAAGAQVGVALVQRVLEINRKEFARPEKPAVEPGDQWRIPTIVTADAEGRFTLPTETDPACAVVAVHAEGIAEMFYADFAAKPSFKLEAWGSIKGTVTVGDAPGKNVEVSGVVLREKYGYPFLVTQNITGMTDGKGHFSIGGIAPGLAQVSLFEFFPKGDFGFGTFQEPPESASKHVVVEPGKAAMAELGGADLKPLPPGIK